MSDYPKAALVLDEYVGWCMIVTRYKYSNVSLEITLGKDADHAIKMLEKIIEELKVRKNG